MDLLTKYRPLKSLEFYQRKVVRFIHSPEGAEDLRSLGIPYELLGFDSPLHFIRCIPPSALSDDNLFQRVVDTTLRKGARVFLTFHDGRIQSAIYKGTISDGKREAVLEGGQSHPLDNVIPYKCFLRRNVGGMLGDGPHKGMNVTYESPKYDTGDSIYYKPSKRWAVILDRDVRRGKVFCEIKLERNKLKKEKVMRVSLSELMRDSVPYRIPVVRKEGGIGSRDSKECGITPPPHYSSNLIQNNAPETKHSSDVIIVKRNTAKALRPLTEYFHSSSVEYHAAIEPEKKCKSVNNLSSSQPHLSDEDEEFTFEGYTNSLRRSARNVLAKQLANEAMLMRRASLSTDNLGLFTHVSTFPDGLISTSGNDSSDGASDYYPPSSVVQPAQNRVKESVSNIYENSNFSTSNGDVGDGVEKSYFLPTPTSPSGLNFNGALTPLLTSNQHLLSTLPKLYKPSKRQRTQRPSGSTSKLFYKSKSLQNITQEGSPPPLPNPFSLENITSAVGRGRGIQSGINSGFMDVTLFSLFYCSKTFDALLTDEEGERDPGMKGEVKRILRDRIVKPLRLSAFCGYESVGALREEMLRLSSKLLHSSFMEPNEFLQLLFQNALNLSEFLKYSNGGKDFMHQIVVRPKDRSKCQDMQFLFETSMGINNLKFSEPPTPALFICMPRCNGRLVYYDAIIPSPTLSAPLAPKGTKRCLCELEATLECALCYKEYGELALAYCHSCSKLSDSIHCHIRHNPSLVPKYPKEIVLSLLAVICQKNNRYSTFLRVGVEKLAPWLYYEATPNQHPQVHLLDEFGGWLEQLEREPGRYKEFAKGHPLLKRIMTEAVVCIYYSPLKGVEGFLI